MSNNGPTRRRTPMSPKLTEITLSLDLTGKFGLSVVHDVIVQFVKYILLQRNQIPQNYDMMKRDGDTNACGVEDEDITINDLCTEGMSLQERKLIQVRDL